MATHHVSYHSEFGLALHETGINKISAGLREVQPEKFAFREEIPIGSNRFLTFYAVTNEPISFNFYPVSDSPEFVEDTFLMQIKVVFTLTDSEHGSITRLKLVAQAGGQIVKRAHGYVIGLLTKKNGLPWFDVTEIEGDHPESVRLVGEAIAGLTLETGEHSVSRLALPGDDDGPTARAFRAIMNFLIDLWLKDGLKKTVTEFPLPDFDDLVELGPLGRLPGKDLYIRNNQFYLTLGNQASGDVAFPDVSGNDDLRLGISEIGLRRLLGLLPIADIPISIGKDNTTFQVRSRNFHVSRIRADLKPGEDQFDGQVYFGGLIEIRINVEVFGAWVRTPWFPLPVDDTLSRYIGKFLPYINSDDKNLSLKIRPSQEFYESWLLLLVTDYRGYFAELFKGWLRSIRRLFIKDKYCKIPIIGWLVCGTFDLLGDVLGWIVGAPLDLFMSSILTIVINAIYRVLRAVLFVTGDSKDEEFSLLDLSRDEFVKQLGIIIGGAAIRQVEDNRGGELQLGLIFNSGSFPAPPPPLPDTPQPPDEPDIDPFPHNPDRVDLPTYSESDFNPIYAIPKANWTPGEELSFQVSIEQAGSVIADRLMTVTFTEDKDYWIVEQSVAKGEDVISKTIAMYASDSVTPTRATVTTKIPGGIGNLESQVAFTSGGEAEVNVFVGKKTHDAKINVMDTRYIELEDIWMFRIAAADLSAAQGKFARIEVSDPGQFNNFARQIPVNIEVRESTWNNGKSDHEIDVWRVIASDEESRTTLIIDRKGNTGIWEAFVEREGIMIRLNRLMMD
ncbi:hypothetical protein ACH5Y9_01155 [Methylomonas sp. BW4-1]|uniref:hypothetical protein n=1 Tax=Methylomonas sp. BW4-1 TaxID=3376685 RepID=UPI004040FC43